MNLPNKLTVLRVIMIPFFVVSLLAFHGEVRLLRNLAAAIFIVASLTDMLDGKLLVCSALICLIELGQLPSWMVIIIVSREFIISGFRLIAAEQGIVIAASYWGKFKTTFQMIAVILMIVDLPVLHILTVACTWIALVLTVVSLVDYIAKNHKVLTEGAI